MRRQTPDPRQDDLFAWAAQQPTAVILDFIGPISRRIWAERNLPLVRRDGKLLKMPVRTDDRRRA